MASSRVMRRPGWKQGDDRSARRHPDGSTFFTSGQRTGLHAGATPAKDIVVLVPDPLPWLPVTGSM